MAIQITSSLTTSRQRRGDIILDRVETLIGLHNSGSGEYASMVHACDLFFTLDYWLKYYTILPGYETEQQGAVMELYGAVVGLLCMAFKTTVNVLPRELESMFGRELTAGGIDVDVTQGLAKYAQDGEIKKYRLFFKEGKIYQFPWWQPNYVEGAMAPCESARSQPAAQIHSAAFGGDLLNWGYCVMSMNREIYMTQHAAGEVELEYKSSNGANYSKTTRVASKGIYHSYYLPGVAVMFSGSMLIDKGELMGISTNSGHYKPTENNLLAALQALQMQNVSLNDVAIYDFKANYVSLAPQFLANGGKWSSLKSNQKASQWQNELAWAERKNPKVKGWVKMRHPVPYGDQLQGVEGVQLPQSAPVVNPNPSNYGHAAAVQAEEEQPDYNSGTSNVVLNLNDSTAPEEVVEPY